VAPDLALVFDHTRLLRDDRHDQGQGFQIQSQYIPVPGPVRDIFSLHRFRLRHMAPGLDGVFDHSRLLHGRKRDKIQMKIIWFKIKIHPEIRVDLHIYL